MKAILIDPFVFDPVLDYWNGKPPIRAVELEHGIRSINSMLSEGLEYDVEQAEAFKFCGEDFLITDLYRFENNPEARAYFVSTGTTMGFVPSRALIVGRSHDQRTLTPPETSIKEVRKRTILYINSGWRSCEISKWEFKYDA